MKRLIVSGDDLGYGAGIDAGILRAHREGILTAATLMTNVPGAERAAALARDTTTLDLGVHLVLTHGRPLSDTARVPTLVGGDGAFLHARDVVGTGRARTEDVLVEYRAQLARGRELLGREPSHVDTHHWVQGEPAVFEAFLALARESGVAARSLDAGERDRLRAAGVRTPDRFRREFYADATGVDELLALLERIAAEGDDTTELMSHPGEPDPDLERRSSYARSRPVELATLTHPAVRRRVDELGLVLSTFAELTTSPERSSGRRPRD